MTAGGVRAIRIAERFLSIKRFRFPPSFLPSPPSPAPAHAAGYLSREVRFRFIRQVYPTAIPAGERPTTLGKNAAPTPLHPTQDPFGAWSRARRGEFCPGSSDPLLRRRSLSTFDHRRPAPGPNTVNTLAARSRSDARDYARRKYLNT